jgi:hypothetical protein
MAAHEIVRGIWRKIEPRPSVVQAMTPRAEISVGAEPDLLAHGIELPQAEPFEIPGTEGDVWARIVPSSAYSIGELLTLETAPAE